MRVTEKGHVVSLLYRSNWLKDHIEVSQLRLAVTQETAWQDQMTQANNQLLFCIVYRSRLLSQEDLRLGVA